MRNLPYLIAEIGVNHEGSLDKAFEMIDQVAEAGWSAAKFQTYSADLLASKSFSKAYWDLSEEPEESQHALFSKYKSFNPSEYEELIERCRSKSIDFLTTAFDEESMKFFLPLMPLVKIASADITNVPLIRLAASGGKPLIVSCGAANLEEVQAAVDIATSDGNYQISLLHCVLNYPTDSGNAHLNGIRELKESFPNLGVGYSDHTKYDPSAPVQPSTVAFILGAELIEKHFTYDRTLPGNDHYHAADYEGLVEIRRQIEVASKLIGEGITKALESQLESRSQARRRIVASRKICEGSFITADDIIPLRASWGIEVSQWDEVLGREAQMDVNTGTPLTWTNLN